jgi:hypothetical protein
MWQKPAPTTNSEEHRLQISGKTGAAVADGSPTGALQNSLFVFCATSATNSTPEPFGGKPIAKLQLAFIRLKING